MILRVGKYGITRIKNQKTYAERDSIIVYKGMNIDGIPSFKESKMDNNPFCILLGYDEEIIFDTKENAVKMFKLINTILVKGAEIENTIKMMINDAKDKIMHKDSSNFDVSFEFNEDDVMERLKVI